MSTISIKSIEKAVEKIDSLDDEALEKLIETFALSQEELLNYIMMAGVEYGNEDLNAFSIYYFAIVMEAFNQEGVKLRTVTEEEVDEFQEPFVAALDAIHDSENYGPIEELVEQLNLLQFMVNEIEAEDEDGDSFDEETKTQLFIVSTSMIGLMNQAITS